MAINVGMPTASQAAPAGMRGRHYAAVHRGKQHRQAVCHHDGADQLAFCGYAGVGFLPVAASAREPKHFASMHLLQKYMTLACRALQQRAVGLDICGRIPDMVTQVQAVVGCN